MDLETERMCHAGFPVPPKGQGFGSLYQNGFYINYLHGLDHLCKEYIKQNTRVLEIGCFYGASSRLFRSYSNSVTCVDTAYYEEMKNVVEQFDVEFVQKDSVAFLQGMEKGSYDLIYIDTTHGFHDTLTEIRNAYEKLDEGQILSGHDYNSKGVQDAVNHFFNYPDIRIFLDSSWAIRKTKNLEVQTASMKIGKTRKKLGGSSTM